MVPRERLELPTCGLGNRCSVLLSYRGARGFPRFAAMLGQSATRETRGELRFAWAQRGAQSVLGPSSRSQSSPPFDRDHRHLARRGGAAQSRAQLRTAS